MGGVDQHDWLLEKHAIAIKGKKWYWSIVTRIIGMSIVNAYLLYRDIHGKISISIKEFRRAIAVNYLKIGHGRRVQRGRSLSLPSNSRFSVSDDVRYYGKDHITDKRDKQRRCQYKSCTGKPLTYCRKCVVTLCIKCFPMYHKK